MSGVFIRFSNISRGFLFQGAFEIGGIYKFLLSFPINCSKIYLIVKTKGKRTFLNSRFF